MRDFGFIIRAAEAHADGAAVDVLARDATDETQGAHSFRRRGSLLPRSTFDGCVVLVAETTSDKRLVGLVSVRLKEIFEDASHHASRWADITLLGVAADMRRRGIGRALMLAAFKLAKEEKMTLITLTVAEHNQAAITLYQSLGGKVVDQMLSFESPNSLVG
jgi:ribosomal protein S18 acetylase RimI-like enzyme